MKKNIFTVLTLIFISCSALASPKSDGVTDYIHQTKFSNGLKIKAEYVTHSIDRILNENWKNSPEIFKSISDDISISLSCYIYEAEKKSEDNKLALIDEIQGLMIDDEYSKSIYLNFMRNDMKNKHIMKNISICSALV